MVEMVRVRRMEAVPVCSCRKARQRKGTHCQRLFLQLTSVGSPFCRTSGFSLCVSCWKMFRSMNYCLETEVSRQDLERK